MTKDNEGEHKGFAGLEGLASEADPTEPITIEREEKSAPPQSASPKPSITESTEKLPRKPPEPSSAKSSNQWKEQESGSTAKKPTKAATVGSDGSDSGIGLGTVVSVVVVLFVIIVNFTFTEQEPTSRPNSNSNISRSNQPQSAPTAPSSLGGVNPAAVPNSVLEYREPIAGSNRTLSISEIRWCLRDDIRLETLRDGLVTNQGIDQFNQFVEFYNARCSSYQYRVGNLERARTDVNAERAQIVSAALAEIRALGGVTNAGSPISSPDLADDNTLTLGDADDTRLVQELLGELGYEPGPIDGVLGQSTLEAIREFQGDSGLTQDGVVDRVLIAALQGNVNLREIDQVPDSASLNTPSGTDGLSALGIPANARLTNGGAGWECNPGYERDEDVCVTEVRRQPDIATSTEPSNNSSLNSISSTALSQTFTRGSHEDDVLRLQGTPDDINVYAASGYESWSYGYSRVKISTSDRRVMEWSNQGNLKAEIQPGRNTTSSQTFTRGSHEDDVLRLQGTPDDINVYAASGYESWSYGYSRVKISTSDRRVMEWSNQGNLKVGL